jgi:hypothetical protein
MNKMMQGNDGFYSVTTTLGDHFGVSIERLLVERRRRPRLINIGGLNSTPLYPQPKTIQPNPLRPIEILGIAVPEIRCRPERHYIAPAL